MIKPQAAMAASVPTEKIGDRALVYEGVSHLLLGKRGSVICDHGPDVESRLTSGEMSALARMPSRVSSEPSYSAVLRRN